MPGLVDQFGRPAAAVTGGGGTPRFFRSATRQARTPWEPNRATDLDRLLPAYDWQTLLSGSRAMFANFGVVRGAVMAKANRAIGQAWLPEFTGTDPASQSWAMAAREWLMEDFYPISDVRGAPYSFTRSLWLDSVAADRDGDVFYLLTSHATSGRPALQHIPAHRIATGTEDTDGTPVKRGPYRGARICNGVIKNRYGRSVAYRVLGPDYHNDLRDYEDISARDLRQIFDPEWHDQGRGIPAASHALNFLKNSLSSHEFEHMALMMLSSIGIIEKNPLGLPDPGDPGNDLGSSSTAATGNPGVVIQDYEAGTIRYFSSTDPNSGLDSIHGERPDDQWDRFQDRTIRFYLAGVDWPYELAWKSQEVNGVTIRNIEERARISVEDRQDLLRPHARAQVSYALGAAVSQGLLPSPPDIRDLARWRFRYPRRVSIDPGRDMRSITEAIASGTETLKDHVESRGSTLEEHFTKILDAEELEARMRAERGLPRPSPPSTPDPADNGDEDNEDSDPDDQ